MPAGLTRPSGAIEVGKGMPETGLWITGDRRRSVVLCCVRICVTCLVGEPRRRAGAARWRRREGRAPLTLAPPVVGDPVRNRGRRATLSSSVAAGAGGSLVEKAGLRGPNVDEPRPFAPAPDPLPLVAPGVVWVKTEEPSAEPPEVEAPLPPRRVEPASLAEPPERRRVGWAAESAPSAGAITAGSASWP